MKDQTQNQNETVRDIALASADIKCVDKARGATPFVVVPDGFVISCLESTLASPLRIRQAVRFEDLKDFTWYVEEFGGVATQVFYTRSGQFHAAIDYHRKDNPAWHSHNVRFEPAQGRKWLLWLGINGKPLAQDVFADFLEENAEDVTDPSSAEIVEIVNTLHEKKSVEFSSAVRLENGHMGLHYIETGEAKAGTKGNLEVPRRIKLGLPPFERGDAYEVEAMFRYRITEGKLTFTVKLLNTDKILEDAVKDFAKTVKEDLGGIGITPLLGALQ